MGHETLEESNQQMEGELKEKIQRILIFIAWQLIFVNLRTLGIRPIEAY